MRLYTILKKIIELFSVDYIVERGSSGAWYYEKWNSGKMVCWGKTSFVTSSTTNTFTVQMPVTFVNTEYIVNATPGNNGSIVTKYGDYNAAGNVSHGYAYFYFTYTASSTYNVYFNFIITGRWK